MKIGILSIYYHNYNFGGCLQAYALCKYLNNRKNCNAEQISLKFTYKTYLLLQAHKAKGTRKIRSTISLIKYITVLFYYRITHPIVAFKLNKRKHIYNNFLSEIPHSTRTFTINNIIQSNDIYDTFICGSDVIWNCGLPAYISALGFTEKTKIAYAPSTGGSKLPDWWKDEYISFVQKFNYISMREQKTADQLEKIIGRRVDCVLDPTLLLTKDEWDELIGNTCVHTRDCFCYLLGNSYTQRKQIEYFAKINNLRLVTEPNIENQTFKKCDKNFGDIQDYQSGPKEFVDHIKNAEVVITDSFHACVFSIIYNKEFYAIPRINNSDRNLSGRIISLLEMLDLKDRYIQNIGSSKRMKIDYSKANAIVEQLRTKSIEYLERSLLRNG